MGLWHRLSQAPQWLLLLRTSTQAPAQTCRPAPEQHAPSRHSPPGQEVPSGRGVLVLHPLGQVVRPSRQGLFEGQGSPGVQMSRQLPFSQRWFGSHRPSSGRQEPPLQELQPLQPPALLSFTQEPPWHDLQAPQLSQHWSWGMHRLPQARELGRSVQVPPRHSRQVPEQPGPAWPSAVFWHRLFWHDLHGPQSSPGQQFPATQVEPHSLRPLWQAPLQGWLRGMQLLPQR
jgi:hypothetical protein